MYSFIPTPGATRRFKQVDVFSQVPFKGNPLAVVLDAEGLDTARMQAIARWTNLAETTFVQAATDPAADYMVRIFSPSTEFAFAGHPTLGTAHALLEAGLTPKTAGRLVQQCGIGLVTVEIAEAGMLAFGAPAARLRDFDPALRPLLDAALGVATPPWPGPGPIMAEMGIGWLVVPMPSAQACLDARADAAALARLLQNCGVDGLAMYGAHPAGAPADYEVRALLIEHGALVEDPVTGSANACVARVLQRRGQIADGDAYSVRQGTALARDGRLQVRLREGQPWIGGACVTVIDGRLRA